MVKYHLKHVGFFYGEIKELFAPWFFSQWGKRASWLALALFSGLMCFSLYQLTQAIRENFFSNPHVILKQDQTSDQLQTLIKQIPATHLFGDAAELNFVPITSLHLKLIGIAKTQTNTSKVIIAEADKIGKVYGIGDTLPSGIRVTAINADSVILENDGHLEKLPLQRAALTFQESAKALWEKDEDEDVS